MSIWDKFYRLDILDIGFYDNTSAQKATIYANGKNQVEFYIKIKIVDKNNNPIDIPDNELIKNIYLGHCCYSASLSVLFPEYLAITLTNIC